MSWMKKSIIVSGHRDLYARLAVSQGNLEVVMMILAAVRQDLHLNAQNMLPQASLLSARWVCSKTRRPPLFTDLQRQVRLPTRTVSHAAGARCQRHFL
jgi:hypothetical protein